MEMLPVTQWCVLNDNVSTLRLYSRSVLEECMDSVCVWEGVAGIDWGTSVWFLLTEHSNKWRSKLTGTRSALSILHEVPLPL